MQAVAALALPNSTQITAIGIGDVQAVAALALPNFPQTTALGIRDVLAMAATLASGPITNQYAIARIVLATCPCPITQYHDHSPNPLPVGHANSTPSLPVLRFTFSVAFVVWSCPFSTKLTNDGKP